MLYRPKSKSALLVDLSPLIDVVFLLLIFFMVSTQFKDDHGMDLALPDSESTTKSEEKFLTIFIDKNQKIHLSDREVGKSDLQERIQAELALFDNKMVVLKVDRSVSHGTVVAVMDAAKSAGAQGLTFATTAKIAEPSP